jgi:heat shock protein HslJ
MRGELRIMRTFIGVILALFCICLEASAQETVTVIGKLSRVAAIGGESTGWAIELEAETVIKGNAVHSVEVTSHDIHRLEALENKRVRATGKVSYWHGVETSRRFVLEVSSIQEAKVQLVPVAAFHLENSEWVLIDLAGSKVIDPARATLAFAAAGKVSGNGSCNRFFGSAKIAGNTIQFGPLGSTRMACPEPVMNQEARYLNALQSAERFEWKDPYLLLYCRGLEKPLRFTRQNRRH